MGFGTIALLGLIATPGQVPADVTPWNSPSMKIPIDYHPSKKGEIRDLLLYVSPDQGANWQQQAVATPEKDTNFNFTAPADGTYWFCMVVVDKSGKRDPADVFKARPEQIMKVLFDTKKPVVTVIAAQRTGDDAFVSWKIVEKNPDWAKFRLEYSVAGTSWTPVTTRPEAEGSAQFRVNGPGAVTVRLSVTDYAGLTGEASRDIAPLPSSTVAKPPTISPPSDLIHTGATADYPSMPHPSTLMANAPDRAKDAVRSTPVERGGGTDTPPAPGIVSPLGPIPAPMGPVGPVIPTTPATSATADPLALAAKTESLNVPPPAVNLNLPPAQVINVTSFKMAYEVEERGASGVGKAELWVTRDEGRTWRSWQTYEKPETPLIIDLARNANPQTEGIYGFKILLHSGAGLAREVPKGGDTPDMRVDVDVTPPIVKIYEPLADSNSKDTMVLRWQAVDRNLATDPITLEWADGPRGPWIPLVTSDATGASPGMPKRLPNTGSYAWKLPSNFPTHKVYLKVSARDLAGNLAEATTANPILVDLNKPSAVKLNIVGGISK